METKSKKIAKAVMVSIVGATLAGGTIAASAAHHKHVKCYGIAKKGANACATSKHACAGQATKNNDPQEWIYAKKSKCLKKGGSVTKPEKN